MRPLPSRQVCHERLQIIFPRAAFDSVLSNRLAAASVAALLYVDAVIDDDAEFSDSVVRARPTTVLWMSDEAYARVSDEDRIAWRTAAAKGNKALVELLRSWGVEHNRWYQDNSRETLRDETWAGWLKFGAIRSDPRVVTTSGASRWSLTRSFADLFDPSLEGDALIAAIDKWRDRHMQPGDLVRIRAAASRAHRAYSVRVQLPDGETRLLAPGDASLILKGVIEQWVPKRLRSPVVLTISEPGDKVYLADAALLSSLGLTIDVGSLLPDAVIVDVAVSPATFWIVEAVASDGPVTEERKARLLRWAERQRIPARSCQFLSAFLSRNHPTARRRLKDIATGTFAWYLDEPERELSWYEISASDA
jgi:BsuBI/PstI restriction endonuclease C-terminus.